MPRRSNHCYFHFACEFVTHILAHMLDSLVRVSRRGKENHFASITSYKTTSVQSKTTQMGLQIRRDPTSPKAIWFESNRCWPKHTHSASLLTDRGNTGISDTGFLRFPFSNFRYSLTLFSKFFASFPHGTCSLSVSCQYLALDGIYHPLWAAIPNNSTRWKQVLTPTTLDKYGSFTL